MLSRIQINDAPRVLSLFFFLRSLRDVKPRKSILRWGFIVTRSAAFHAFSRAAFPVMSAVSRSHVSLRLCTPWTEALMAIVSRSCRLAGFYRLDFASLSLFFSHFRTHVLVLSRSSPSPAESEYSSSAARSPLAGRPKARRVFLSKYSPVVISRKTPFFSPETGEILACSSIGEEREEGSREERLGV